MEERPVMADPDALLNVYADPRRAPWTVDALSRLWALAAEPGGPARPAEASGLKVRALRDVLAGRSNPRQAAREGMVGLLDRALAPIVRSCPGCGAPLQVGDPRRRHCSARCRKRASRTRNVDTPPVNVSGRTTR